MFSLKSIWINWLFLSMYVLTKIWSFILGHIPSELKAFNISGVRVCFIFMELDYSHVPTMTPQIKQVLGQICKLRGHGTN